MSASKYRIIVTSPHPEARLYKVVKRLKVILSDVAPQPVTVRIYYKTPWNTINPVSLKIPVDTITIKPGEKDSTLGLSVFECKTLHRDSLCDALIIAEYNGQQVFTVFKVFNRTVPVI